LTALIDARALPDATVLTPDLAIIGGGAAGISLALALADSKISIALLESGGMNFDPKVQNMYAGEETGVRYTALDAGRLRFMGGSTNHWGGWCRPMDEADFEEREWMAHSGWPINRDALKAYYPRAQELVEAGAWMYDHAGPTMAAMAPLMPLGAGGVYTSWFQFSKTRDSVLPTYFGHRYEQDLRAAKNVTPYSNANVTGIRLSASGRSVDHLDVATLNGKHFKVKPRMVVLAAGGMENARLLLVSNDVVKPGVGNENDLVGRFFADNPIPRDVATLVVFAGALPAYYGTNTTVSNGTILLATFAPTPAWRRTAQVGGSLTTVEDAVDLDETGRAAVITTALALGVDASSAKAYSLGCGMELEPDPERRLMLAEDKDALGLPRLKLDMRISDADFARYRKTLAELGRQLLASRTGMLRINYDHREQWLKAMDWGNHHLGTTRMSKDPKLGVVDADCKVHMVDNLYVAGSSVFPTYSASNPTLNLVALTLRLGDHLKKVMA
jgi:choline dehydrogenase-like flavoprotein